MSRQVSILLIVGILAAALAVVAVAAVVLTSDDPPAAAPPTATALPKTAETDPEPAAPPKSRPAQSHRNPAASTPSPDAEEPVEPDLSPEETARAEAEDKAREEVARFVRDARRKVISEFSLTSEQAAAADPAITQMCDVMQAMAPLVTEAFTRRELLLREARENAWTAEQTKQVRERAARELVVAHQGELLQLIDSYTQATEQLRPHLTNSAQVYAFDRKMTFLRNAREQIIQGTYPLF